MGHETWHAVEQRNEEMSMAKQNNRNHTTGLTPNGRTRNFSMAAPEAATVQLAGDFTQWQ